MSLRPIAVRRFAWDCVLLAGIWAVTLYRAAAFWWASPEYAYGFVVPFLAGSLLAIRHRNRPAAQVCRRTAGWLALTSVCAALWVGANFLLAAFPQWPAAGWMLLVAAIALTAAFYACAGGAAWLLYFAFPFAFLLTSLPLPAAIRQPSLDAMTPLVTLWATTIANEIGIPALRHGRVIEVAHGFVGIEDACAGLRSVEATLMVSLFLGEYWMLAPLRRLALVIAGLACAVAGNILRVVILTWAVARQTNTASPDWHDFAGYGALIVTLGGVFVAALILRRTETTDVRKFGGETKFKRRPRFLTAVYGATLAGCLVPTLWFGSPTGSATDRARHEVELPTSDPSFQPADVAASTAALLHCDLIVAGRWVTSDGIACTGYVIRWHHGHEAQFALALHNPKICLPSTGLQFQRSLPELPIAGPLTCQGAEFANASQRLDVYAISFRMPSLGPLPEAPRTVGDWWRWRVDALRRHERDEDVANVTLVFEAQEAKPSRVAAEMKRIIRRSL